MAGTCTGLKTTDREGPVRWFVGLAVVALIAAFLSGPVGAQVDDDGGGNVCTEDIYEENDSLATAAPLTVGNTLFGQICVGDPDYYNFLVGVDDLVEVFLGFTHADGDLELKIYDPAGALFQSLTSSTDNETFTWTTQTAGVWTVEVEPFSQAENDYELLVDVTPDGSCVDDPYEENDTVGSATPLDLNALPPDTVMCAGDEDWFSFPVSEGDDVFVTYSAGQLDVNVETFDADGNPAPPIAVDSGIWTIKVTPDPAITQPEVPYNLVVQITCGDDQYEDNDTRVTATPITVDSLPDDAVMCDGDVDWYSYDVTAGDNVFANYFAGNGLDVSLSLEDENGNQPPAIAVADATWFMKFESTSNYPSVPYGLILSITPDSLCDEREATINMNTNGGIGVGTAGDDIIVGTPGDDVIDGLEGNDLICGGGGNDIISGRQGEDEIFGEGGDDVINGGVDVDFIYGGLGQDVIGGQGGADFLFGDEGNDVINGGVGEDVIFGGQGDDDLRGQGDADELYGDAGIDQLYGGSGNDYLNTGTGGNSGTAQVVRGQGNNDTIDGGPDDDNLDGGPGFDIINGGAGNDTISGGNAVDTLDGEGGNDTLFGGQSNDTLHGGDNDDDLFGGVGNDTLNGDAGADDLVGQGGFDTCNGGAGSPDTATSCESQSGIP